MNKRFKTLLTACLSAAATIFPFTGQALTAPANTPTVTQVLSSTADGTYKKGSRISISVAFLYQVVVAGGTPELILETGTTDRRATYVGGSGGYVLSFEYIVQPGDHSSDLDYHSTAALDTKGATIRDLSNTNDAILALPVPGAVGSLAAGKNLVIDGIAPLVTAVSVPAAGNYGGTITEIDFIVGFDDQVTVSTAGGTPQLSLDIAGNTRYANYVFGSGSSAIVFRYAIPEGEEDTDGIQVGTISASGGSLRDASGNDADLTLNNVGSTAAVNIDRIKPVPVLSSAAGLSGSASATAPIPFTVTFSENVSGLTRPEIHVINGYADNFSGSGTTYSFTVTPLAAGNVTVSIPAHVAFDAAYNYNAASADFTIDYQGILPVVLRGFSVSRAGNGARLQWQTASETDSRGFELHRAGTDGRFEKLAAITGKGNTATGHSYSYLDGQPLNGQNYYRLVQFDLNGKGTELGERAIDFSLSGNGLRLYPNPVADRTNVSFPAGRYQRLVLIGLEGRILQQATIKAGQTDIELDLSAYPKGTYLVQLYGGETTVQKLVKH